MRRIRRDGGEDEREDQAGPAPGLVASPAASRADGGEIPAPMMGRRQSRHIDRAKGFFSDGSRHAPESATSSSVVSGKQVFA